MQTVAQRLAIVTWIAANPEAGDVIERTGGARKVRFAGKGRAAGTGRNILHGGGYSGFLAQHICQERENQFDAKRAAVLKTVLADMVKAYRSGRVSR